MSMPTTRRRFRFTRSSFASRAPAVPMPTSSNVAPLGTRQHFRVPPGGESENQGVVNEAANHANPAAGSWESMGKSRLKQCDAAVVPRRSSLAGVNDKTESRHEDRH